MVIAGIDRSETESRKGMIIKLVIVLVAVYSIVKITDFMEYMDATRKAKKLNKRAVENNSIGDYSA